MVFRVFMGSALLATLLCAKSASAEYTTSLTTFLQTKSFEITGRYYTHDFDGNGAIDRSDWVYVGSNALAYQLMGNTPSSIDPFGWKALEAVPSAIDTNNPQGYFIKIDFPTDISEGNGAFSWLYVTSAGAVYKLMGATSEYNFDYLDSDGDGIADALSTLQSSKTQEAFTFETTETTQASSSSSSANTIEAITSNRCEDSLNSTYQGKSYSYTIVSGYTGNVGFDCKFYSEFSWFLSNVEMLEIADIVQTRSYEGTVEGKQVLGSDTIYYKKGESHYNYTVEGESASCADYYTPFDFPLFVTDSEDLSSIFDQEGEPNMDGAFKTTCPEDSIIKDEEPSSQDIKAYTNYTITDVEGKVHKVYQEGHIVIK